MDRESVIYRAEKIRGYGERSTRRVKERARKRERERERSRGVKIKNIKKQNLLYGCF